MKLVFLGMESCYGLFVSMAPERSVESRQSVIVSENISHQSFLDDCLKGLSQNPKSLPCKYFYDERGSQLFDQICETEAYYVTRTETALMQQYTGEMGECLASGVKLVEFGSGSSLKTRYLLEELIAPAAYVPVDISKEHLLKSAERISEEFSEIEVLPVCADFTQSFELPESTVQTTHNAVYFPGSTIGNFEPNEALGLLHSIADLCGNEGGLLIGIDLQKEAAILENAYDDPDGVTAQFNLNLLHRMNRELDAGIDVGQFEHHVQYNEQQGRVEIYLRCCDEQTIDLQSTQVRVEPGELIHTENSHKYTISGFSELAAQAGWKLRKSWSDSRSYFAVLHFVCE